MAVKNLFGEKVIPQGHRRYAGGLGCDFCPRNNVPGINKVKNLDRIKQRRAMLWGISPWTQENIKGLELVGPSGKLLWEELKPLGLSRDSFDVQNVARCMDKTTTPTKRVLQCCSIYNDEAIYRNAEHAVVHLVLGEVPALQLLGKVSKANPIIWHEPWNAYVIQNYHPAYILRQIKAVGGKFGYHYLTFKERLAAVKPILEHPGRYGYIKAQNYGAVRTCKEMEWLRNKIHSEAAAGRRVSVDIEDGVVNGKPVILCIGFGWGEYTKKGYNYKDWRGGARSVVLYHPEADQSPARIRPLLAMLREVLEDPKIKKTLQHGNYDDENLQELLGFKLRGYEYDTQYASYLKNSQSKQGYSLKVLINQSLLEFADYKTTMMAPYSGNFATAPLETLVTYCCADADATKRLEYHTEKYINAELLKIYVHDAYVLDDMETRGPILDRKELSDLLARIEPQLEGLRSALARIANKPDFNPGSPDQVAWLLFDKLKLPETENRSTEAEDLELLFQQTGHKALPLVKQHRSLDKIKSTYCLSYETSANMNDGEVRTTWWLTGAATGRLRSGGKNAEGVSKEGRVNLQNRHGNKLTQNMLVSDLNWRLALK